MELTITRPDDWHLHLRDDAMLRAVVPWSARHFARAIIMPNLVPPVTSARLICSTGSGCGIGSVLDALSGDTIISSSAKQSPRKYTRPVGSIAVLAPSNTRSSLPPTAAVSSHNEAANSHNSARRIGH